MTRVRLSRPANLQDIVMRLVYMLLATHKKKNKKDDKPLQRLTAKGQSPSNDFSQKFCNIDVADITGCQVVYSIIYVSRYWNSSGYVFLRQ